MWPRNWFNRAKIAIGQQEKKYAQESGIPLGYSTHDYVGGSPLLRKLTNEEISERREKVEKSLQKY